MWKIEFKPIHTVVSISFHWFSALIEPTSRHDTIKQTENFIFSLWIDQFEVQIRFDSSFRLLDFYSKKTNNFSTNLTIHIMGRIISNRKFSAQNIKQLKRQSEFEIRSRQSALSWNEKIVYTYERNTWLHVQNVRF